jgi:hypothetical protein
MLKLLSTLSLVMVLAACSQPREPVGGTEAAQQNLPSESPKEVKLDLERVDFTVEGAFYFDDDGGPQAVKISHSNGKWRLDQEGRPFWMIFDYRNNTQSVVIPSLEQVISGKMPLRTQQGFATDLWEGYAGVSTTDGDITEMRGFFTGKACSALGETGEIWRTAQLAAAETSACITKDGISLRLESNGRVGWEARKVLRSPVPREQFSIPPTYSLLGEWNVEEQRYAPASVQ